MKTRVMTSVVLVALIAAVVVLGNEILGTAIFIVSLIAVDEFIRALRRKNIRPSRIISFGACIPVLAICFKSDLEALGIDIGRLLVPLIFLMIMLLFVTVISSKMTFCITDMAVTILCIFYIPFLFAFIPLTRSLNNGQYYVWLIFIGAWVTDTCAFFAGSLLGRTKILPAVSPKKSVEGTIGGVIGSITGMTIFGMLLKSVPGNLPLYHFVIIGLLCGVVSQVGDWSASVIKRFTAIKDYSSLMPGHGGVLDRFDSILFTAPAVYFYLTLIAAV